MYLMSSEIKKNRDVSKTKTKSKEEGSSDESDGKI